MSGGFPHAGRASPRVADKGLPATRYASVLLLFAAVHGRGLGALAVLFRSRFFGRGYRLTSSSLRRCEFADRVAARVAAAQLFRGTRGWRPGRRQALHRYLFRAWLRLRRDGGTRRLRHIGSFRRSWCRHRGWCTGLGRCAGRFRKRQRRGGIGSHWRGNPGRRALCNHAVVLAAQREHRKPDGRMREPPGQRLITIFGVFELFIWILHSRNDGDTFTVRGEWR